MRGQGGGRGAAGGPNRGGRGPGGRPPAGRQVSARAPRPSRLSPSTIAIAAVSLVVVIVIVIVAVKVTGGGSGSSGSGLTAPKPFPASAKVLNEVESVPASVQDTVGAWSSVGTSGLTGPSYKAGQPALTLPGSSAPGAFYIGGVFCPYCAATRWALLMAFSKFGTFTGVQETTSSPWDVYPDTPTLDFSKATYTSSYIDFKPIEYFGQDTTKVNSHPVVGHLTTQENKLYVKYDAVNGTTGVPFVDIDNQTFITGAPIDPQLLAGMTQAEVAGQLTNAHSQVTQAIVGTANALIAGICNADGQKPTAVCTNAGVKAAASAMGLS